MINFLKRQKKIGLLAHSFGSLLALEFLNDHQLEIPSIFVSWTYDDNWLNLFEAKHDPKKIISYSIDENTSPEEKLKNHMLSYIKFYFSENYVEQGKKILQNIHYFPNWTNHIGASFLEKADFNYYLDDLKFPILSIIGQTDGILYEEYYEKFKSNKNIQHVSIKNTRHFPFIEKSIDFRDLILNYLTNQKK